MLPLFVKLNAILQLKPKMSRNKHRKRSVKTASAPFFPLLYGIVFFSISHAKSFGNEKLYIHIK